jgi:hypothetical protein
MEKRRLRQARVTLTTLHTIDDFRDSIGTCSWEVALELGKLVIRIPTHLTVYGTSPHVYDSNLGLFFFFGWWGEEIPPLGFTFLLGMFCVPQDRTNLESTAF